MNYNVVCGIFVFVCRPLRIDVAKCRQLVDDSRIAQSGLLYIMLRPRIWKQPSVHDVRLADLEQSE